MSGLALVELLVFFNLGIFMGVFTVLLMPEPLVVLAMARVKRVLPEASDEVLGSAVRFLFRLVAWAGCGMLFISATFTGFVVALLRSGHLTLW